ncbi:peptidyl-tRNA hydrolase [Spiroplasma chinense]|uniref:Peptidyl-tRNA hydrolase n=1 Tax=Spiroplasma chinense TaxID=216932 RepID=A0A5B9Y8Q5_9MOLU|nr:aminoacyl-tRNA hydrolase [Spiroplasma chinense]QEH62402.1 peptidyl-tRNA hydrolase [Spiroplasma chinense]
MPKLIVGLGNPGRQYETTRHNAGFICLDAIMNKFIIQNEKEDFKAKLYFSNINGEKIIFAKPQTFMNLSGEAVVAIMNFYKIKIEDIIVIYDDKDLNIGKLRFREQGSAGGHNGVKNIIKLLGTEKFNRVRVGIDPPAENYKIVDWVLSKMSNQEIGEIENKIVSVANFVNDFASGDDFKKIMNSYNK